MQSGLNRRATAGRLEAARGEVMGGTSRCRTSAVARDASVADLHRQHRIYVECESRRAGRRDEPHVSYHTAINGDSNLYIFKRNTFNIFHCISSYNNENVLVFKTCIGL